jgi:alkylation response protein AidB-like acyl-CoA dehydrogenase
MSLAMFRDPLAAAGAVAAGIAERAAAHDEDGSFPEADFRALHEAGLLGLRIAERFGGADTDPLTYARVLEAVAAAGASTGLALNMHSSATALLGRLGDEDQCERWLRPVVDEGRAFASLTSEPNVSLRKTRFSTALRRVDGGYLLDGLKHAASLAGFARSYLVFAGDASEGGGSGRRALAALVPADRDGTEVVPTWDATGMRATNSHSVRFTECFVPAEDVIEIDLDRDGNVTDLYLLGYGAVFVGIAGAAHRVAVDYAKGKRFGPDDVTIAHYPAIQRNVAEMTVRLEALRGLVYRAAREADGAPPRERAHLLLQAKWAGAVAARDITDQALQVVGGAGYGRRMPLERYLRDARAGVVMPPNLDACLETIGMLALDIDPPGGLFGGS